MILINAYYDLSGLLIVVTLIDRKLVWSFGRFPLYQTNIVRCLIILIIFNKDDTNIQQ